MPLKIANADMPDLNVDAIAYFSYSTAEMRGGTSDTPAVKAQSLAQTQTQAQSQPQPQPQPLAQAQSQPQLQPQSIAAEFKTAASEGIAQTPEEFENDVAPRFCINTLIPSIIGQSAEDIKAIVSKTYLNVLAFAASNSCESVAVPLITADVCNLSDFPISRALRVASEAIQGYLESNEIYVILIASHDSSSKICPEISHEVEAFIAENYIRDHASPKFCAKPNDILLDAEIFDDCQDPAEEALLADTVFINEAPQRTLESFEYARKIETCEAPKELDRIIENLDEPFSASLLRLIDLTGKTDAEVYKKANIDRRLFSKIRSGNGYMPSKRTIIALAISFELTLKETSQLLGKAGYSLSHSQKFDVIIEYFLTNEMYDIFEINEVLFHYDLALLGGCG